MKHSTIALKRNFLKVPILSKTKSISSQTLTLVFMLPMFCLFKEKFSIYCAEQVKSKKHQK